MFKRYLTLCFILLCALSMGGCKEEIANQPTGKPIGISYEHRAGSIYGDDISIRISTEEIVYAECFSEEILEYIVVEHSPIDSEVWDTAEGLVLAAYPYLTEVTEPTWADRMRDRFQRATILDGGDDETLMVAWETENGVVVKEYGTAYTDETVQLEQWLRDLTRATIAQEEGHT